MKFTKQTWEELSLSERTAILKSRKLKIQQQRAEERALIEQMRRSGELRRLEEKYCLSPSELKIRSNRAWRKAKQFDPAAEFIDYELLMLKRPEKCPECEKDMNDENTLSITHIVALERFGQHTTKNIQIIHTSCHKKAIARLRSLKAAYAKVGNSITTPPSTKHLWKEWSERREKEKLEKHIETRESKMEEMKQKTFEEWKKRAESLKEP